MKCVRTYVFLWSRGTQREINFSWQVILRRVSESWYLDGDICVIRAPLHPRASKSSPSNPINTHSLQRGPFMQRSAAAAASLPSIFARLDSLLAPRAEPHPVARSTRSRREGAGIRRKKVALAKAIWVSHLQQGCRCDSSVLAACSERLATTGPDDRGERLPRRLKWRAGLLIITTMSSVNKWSATRWRKGGTELGWWSNKCLLYVEHAGPAGCSKWCV